MKKLSFEDYIDELIELIPIGETLDDQELTERSSTFLEGLAKVINAKRDVEEEKIQAETLEDTVFAEVLSEQQGGDAEKRKALTKADPRYVKAKEARARAEADLNRMNGLLKVMEHAHVFNRQLRSGNKGGNGGM